METSGKCVVLDFDSGLIHGRDNGEAIVTSGLPEDLEELNAEVIDLIFRLEGASR